MIGHSADPLLCDTGVPLAAGNSDDQAHQACVRLLRQAEGPLLVPSPVLDEVGCKSGYRWPVRDLR